MSPDPPDLSDLLGPPDGPPLQGPVVSTIPGTLPGSPLPFPIPTNAPDGFGGTELGQLVKKPVLNGRELPLHARADVAGEWVPDYATAHQAMAPAAENLDSHAASWQALHDNVVTARNDFYTWLDQTLHEEGGWRGQTAAAIVAKAKESLGKLDELAMAAGTMSILLKAFGNCIGGTRNLIMGREAEWQNEVVNCAAGSTPETRKDKENELNLFAQEVIRSLYNPTILSINGKHPDIGTDAPHVGGPGGGPAGVGFGGGSGGPGGPTGPKPGGLGLPNTAGGLSVPGGADPSSNQPNVPTIPAMQGAGDAANGAGDAAKNAAGQAGNAASQALDQATKAGKNPAGLPEGVLGLGPRGLSGMTKQGGSGSGAGGRGGGAGARGTSLASKVATPSTPVTKAAASTAAPTSRAGIGQSGGPGAGAPMAGHHGGKAGKDHRASKALRDSRHGAELIGEADAVVPVIGDDARPGEAAPSSPVRRD